MGYYSLLQPSNIMCVTNYRPRTCNIGLYSLLNYKLSASMLLFSYGQRVSRRITCILPCISVHKHTYAMTLPKECTAQYHIIDQCSQGKILDSHCGQLHILPHTSRESISHMHTEASLPCYLPRHHLHRHIVQAFASVCLLLCPVFCPFFSSTSAFSLMFLLFQDCKALQTGFP